MKKYKEWLTNEIEIMESETSEYYPHEQMVEREVVLNLINQLDEPEVLSKDWIDENKKYEGVHDIGYYIPVDKLYEKIVPKQEELEVKIQELIEAYKQEEDAYGELENGWIKGFIKDLKNLVEDKQKYYVLVRDEEYGGFWFLTKNSNGSIAIGVGTDWSEVNWDRLKLTEQEIKDYDERYWSFAKKVEELEE